MRMSAVICGSASSASRLVGICACKCAVSTRVDQQRCVAFGHRSYDGCMPVAEEALPVTDARLADPALDLSVLARIWAAYGARRAMTAEQMMGADRKAQRLGVPGRELMEQAGTAVAVAARALLNSTDRPSSGLVLILAGPGNNGGDAFVAARRLAEAGIRSYVVLVSAATKPGTPDAAANWARLEGVEQVQRMQAGSGREVAILGNGIERAALIIDGLLGTGVRGALREPVEQAVGLCLAARRAGVPILSIDT